MLGIVQSKNNGNPLVINSPLVVWYVDIDRLTPKRDMPEESNWEGLITICMVVATPSLTYKFLLVHLIAGYRPVVTESRHA